MLESTFRFFDIKFHKAAIGGTLIGLQRGVGYIFFPRDEGDGRRDRLIKLMHSGVEMRLMNRIVRGDNLIME
jgi:hypothetical protein